MLTFVANSIVFDTMQYNGVHGHYINKIRLADVNTHLISKQSKVNREADNNILFENVFLALISTHTERERDTHS